MEIIQEIDREESDDIYLLEGKIKCQTLRLIREGIAKLNEIDMEFPECREDHKCMGTCPFCEEELKVLEEKLSKKRERGEEVILSDVGKEPAAQYAKEVKAETAIINDHPNEMMSGIPLLSSEIVKK